MGPDKILSKVHAEKRDVPDSSKSSRAAIQSGLLWMDLVEVHCHLFCFNCLKKQVIIDIYLPGLNLLVLEMLLETLSLDCGVLRPRWESL